MNSDKLTVNDKRKITRLFTCFPCVLVTVDNNIITIAMVHVFSFDPPLIGIGVAPTRHSYHLLRNSEDFVVNIPTEELVEKVHICGETSGKKVDKFEVAKLTKEPSLTVSSPSIKECPVSLEVKKIGEYQFGDHNWFIGKIVKARVKKDYNPEKMIMYWGGKYRVPGRVIKRRY